MVCALYPLCAILLGTMTKPGNGPRGHADLLAVMLFAAKERETIRD